MPDDVLLVTGGAGFIGSAVGRRLVRPARADQPRCRCRPVPADRTLGWLGHTESVSDTTPHQPTSPYAATKAGAGPRVRAWHQTDGLPTIISNCSNHFGSYQFPEKFI